MSTPLLHFGLQRDIYALFNRPELSRISETNRRVNAIIEKHFVSSPRLIFDYVHYKNGVWKWLANADLGESNEALEADALPMSDSQIVQLSTSKFLRFKLSHFEFDGGKYINFYVFMNFVFKKRNPVQWITNSIFKQSSSIDIIKAHKHIWEDGRLRIFAMDFWCSNELADLVNTSHDLYLLVPGAVNFLPQLIQGSSKHIAVGDADFSSNSSENIVVNTIVGWMFNYTKQLSLDAISNFMLDNLCRNDQCTSFNFRICTNYMPKYCQEVVDSIKQKFLETPDPSEFRFEITGIMDWPQAHDWTLDHPHKNKELRFEITNQYISLQCSVSE